ncbi:MAG: Gfo/Idh/MocA family protein [Blautia marasmi]
MEKVLRVGVLGMGNMGKAHARSMMKMENVKIAGLCSSPADDARAFACENHLDCGIYDDGYCMIEEAGLDALYICLPPFAHSGQLEAAADRGIHVFIEKPIALNVERESPWQTR